MPAMDVDATCRFILDQFPEIPFWPQFVNLDPFEDMTLQYSEGLSPIRLRDDGKALCVQTEGMETELALLYEHYLDEDTDAFAIGPDHARGLYTLIDLMEEAPSSNETYVKGQSVGPITFASSVALPDGRSHPERARPPGRCGQGYLHQTALAGQNACPDREAAHSIH